MTAAGCRKIIYIASASDVGAILVTGACGHIGREVGRVLSNADCRILAVDLDEDKTREVLCRPSGWPAAPERKTLLPGIQWNSRLLRQARALWSRLKPSQIASSFNWSNMTTQTETSPQIYARIAAVLLLVSIVTASFGELYVPDKLIVSGDAAATANNFRANESLFRLGFASYLIEAVCDVALALTFYILLRPVRKDLALLTAFLGLMSTAMFAVAMLIYFGVSLILLGKAEYLKTFSPDQLNSLALLFLTWYATGAGIFMVFYGVASILRGYLIYRSGYLPRFLGFLLALAGVSFVIRNFVEVLAPTYAFDILYLPMIIAMLSMAVWFIAKGVDVAKWKEKTRVTVAHS
jgi:Domain of unknown function (DUF4386)